MTSATDLGGANGWQYTYGLSKSAQITWDAESGTVGLAPVDARASAYEFGPKTTPAVAPRLVLRATTTSPASCAPCAPRSAM